MSAGRSPRRSGVSSGAQLQGGDLGAVHGVVFEAEGIVEVAERAAAFADDRLLALVQLAADDQERRQLGGVGRLAAGNRGHGSRHHGARRRTR